MKKLFILVLSIITISSYAQCDAPVCESELTIPIIDVNWWNNHAPINKCAVGSGNIPTSANYNGAWTFLSFNAIGYLKSDQVINFLSGSTVHTLGDTVELASLNFVGSSTLNATAVATYLPYITANNHTETTPNIINLASGSHVYYGDTEYFDGEYIQLSGNETNRVYIYSCIDMPLPIIIKEFYLKGNKLFWNIETDGIDLVYVEYSIDGKHYKPEYWTSVTKGTTIIHNNGFYRIKVGNKYSTVIPYNTGKTGYMDNTIRNIEGKIITNPKPYEPYVQYNQVHCITE